VKSTETENGGVTRPLSFMDVAEEGGENVLHTHWQVAANDVKLLDERGANELS
jgi:hypothetical protein